MVLAWLTILALFAIILSMPFWVAATAPWVDRFMSRWVPPVTPPPTDAPDQP